MGEPKRTRLVAFGFDDGSVAHGVVAVLKDGLSRKELVVEDWAMLSKAVGGELTITSDKSAHPGAARGAAFGGGAGLVLAALSGPVGVGAVLGGAAVGAVTAAMKDSGFKKRDLEAVSTLMADGRTGLLVAVPLAGADRFDAFVGRHPEFNAAERRYQVDIVPGRTFELALEQYRRHEEDQPPP